MTVSSRRLVSTLAATALTAGAVAVAGPAATAHADGSQHRASASA